MDVFRFLSNFALGFFTFIGAEGVSEAHVDEVWTLKVDVEDDCSSPSESVLLGSI